MPIGSRSPTSWLEANGADGVITRLNAALEGRYSIERELGEGGAWLRSTWVMMCDTTGRSRSSS